MPSGAEIPETISPASPYTFTYKQTYNSNYQDAFITDVLTVTADTPEKAGVEAGASLGIKIGNPPDSCPNGWPVSGSYIITQTPGGGFSHSRIQAMDIATPLGVPVRTTHSGVARVVNTSGPYRPIYVDVVSNCGGKQFTSRYAHLIPSSIVIRNGQQVTLGQVLGASGTNAPDNAHLHYEFIGLPMTPPYVPKPLRGGCSSNTGQCGSLP
jgi:murein DD-endopeptidase MepM/ murein hydrolase activator NlpD